MNDIEYLNQALDDILKNHRGQITDHLVENYNIDDIHTMTRLLRQRRQNQPTDEDRQVLAHIESLFNLARSIKRTI